MMQLGDKNRWWNRPLPIKRFGAFTALSLVAGSGYLYLSPALSATAWAIAHRSTATFQGLDFKIPLMWKQEDTPAGQHELRLVRARWGEPVSLESIVIRYEATPRVPPQTMMEQFEIVASRLHEPAFRGELLEVDATIKENYSCILPHLTKLPEWQIWCESIDRHWTANLMGSEQDKDDLIKVVHNLSSAQHKAASQP
jgi:hypothetical protein